LQGSFSHPSKVVTPTGTFWWKDKNKKRIFNKNFARKIKRSFGGKINVKDNKMGNYVISSVKERIKL
jgi:hypothetical protein